MKILGTGLTGLVGSRIVELSPFKFEQFNHSTGIDIQNYESVFRFVSSSDAPIIFHLAAKTDVDGCEKDKDLKENGKAWKINVLGTQHIIDACKKTNKKIIYVSTDFVFGGTSKEGYTEQDVPHPINWYGTTKYEGEKIVQNAGIPYIIVRISYPFRTYFEKKLDFVRIIKQRLEQKLPISAVTDHKMSPTFIDDIATSLQVLIEKNESGIFHVAGSSSLSPFEAAIQTAEVFKLDKNLVSKTSRAEFFKQRAPRPFNLTLKNDKITRLGIKIRTFEEGLWEVKRQIENV